MYINVRTHFLVKKDSLFCFGAITFCYKNGRWNARWKMLRSTVIGVVSVGYILAFRNPDNRYSVQDVRQARPQCVF
jgi:hypothetical protein